MKHSLLLWVLLSLMAIALISSCSENSDQESPFITEEEYLNSIPDSAIVIPTIFKPTLDLSSEEFNQSLEELIVQNKGQYNNADREIIRNIVKKRVAIQIIHTKIT